MVRKNGGACAVSLSGEGALSPYLTQCGLSEAYLRTKWHLDQSSRLATIHGPKIGAMPFLEGAGSPSNTMWPRPRPITMPSFILTTQPSGNNIPTSQTGQADNGPIKSGEPFYKRSPKNRSACGDVRG